MMTAFEKSAYRGTLRAFLAVFVVVLLAGFIGEGINRFGSNSEKAEGFIADLQTMTVSVPRTLDGAILRQGLLSTGWLANAGALPPRLQATDSLRRGENQRPIGLVRRSPWSNAFPIETKGSLLWVWLINVTRPVCQHFAAVMQRRPDQVAYISSFGNPAIIPAMIDQKHMCSQSFNSFVLLLVDPATEVRRLSVDVKNAITTMPTDPNHKMTFSGSSALFEVNNGLRDIVKKGAVDSIASIQNDESRSKVTINSVPFAVCRLALLLGPQTFGMDAFEAADGTIAPSPLTGPAPEALCTDLKGRLVMTRNRAG